MKHKISSLVVGVIVIALAALILADGVNSYMGNVLFPLPAFKLMVGIVLIVLAASYLRKE